MYTYLSGGKLPAFCIVAQDQARLCFGVEMSLTDIIEWEGCSVFQELQLAGVGSAGSMGSSLL